MRVRMTDTATVLAVETDSYGGTSIAAEYDIDVLPLKTTVGRKRADDQPFAAYDLVLLLDWEDDEPRQLLVAGSADVRVTFQARRYGIGKVDLLHDRRGELEFLKLYLIEGGA